VTGCRRGWCGAGRFIGRSAAAPLPAAGAPWRQHMTGSAPVGVRAGESAVVSWLAYLAVAGSGLGGVLVPAASACSRAVASPSHPVNG